jgi:trehalose 6-phosphate phosphatase
MEHLFGKTGREILDHYAWSSTLLAFDFDGTLAPIVSRPERAALRPRTRKLLVEVARLYPCVVISGRGQPDVSHRLEGVPIQDVVGNHGLEPHDCGEQFEARVRRWRPVLERLAGSEPGVAIEDKRFSVAIHYRQSRRKKRARFAIAAVVAQLGDVRVIPGKQVVNVLPPGAPHKGVALERMRSQMSCDTAIYVGDDDTDEDAFALNQPGQLLSVRVGANRTSAAQFYLRDQKEIDILLQHLAQLRRRNGSRRASG